MNMRNISVPDYVAEEFNRALKHPSNAPDAVNRSLTRVFKLTSIALQGVDFPEWEVDDGQFGSKTRNEPYGFHRVGDKFYVYVEERGRRSAVGIFKDDHIAAKFFVWLVSHGERDIDWSLYLELEP